MPKLRILFCLGLMFFFLVSPVDSHSYSVEIDGDTFVRVSVTGEDVPNSIVEGTLFQFRILDDTESGLVNVDLLFDIHLKANANGIEPGDMVTRAYTLGSVHKDSVLVYGKGENLEPGGSRVIIENGDPSLSLDVNIGTWNSIELSAGVLAFSTELTHSSASASSQLLRLSVEDELIWENPVPIPSAVWLLGSGLVGLIGFRRKFRRV